MAGENNGIKLVQNNFAVRSKVVEYNPADSSPVGMAREVIKRANTPNAFETANILTGDFIFQVLPGDTSTDFLFDEFLAAAKISGRLDFTPGAGKFKPFIAVVNIPQITFLPTPLIEEKDSPDFNRRIRNIVTTLGVFVKYNYVGHEFAVPNYGDPVQVTFSDMELFKGPTFIGPLNTGIVNTMGTSTYGYGAGSGYYDNCGRKPAVTSKLGSSTSAPPSVITSTEKVDKFITSLDQVDILKGRSRFGTLGEAGPESDKVLKYEIAIPKNTDKSKPVTVFLMFHGDSYGGDASIKNMITKGPSHIPDGHNIVLIRPYLGKTPSEDKLTTVMPQFLTGYGDDTGSVLEQSGLNAGIESLVTFSHSGGGSAHAYFLLQLFQPENKAAGFDFNSLVSASRFLDSDYGWKSVTKLFTDHGSEFNQSKITFLTKAGDRPDKFATGKYKSEKNQARYSTVYKNGARVIRANISHGKCAYQIGPEYLIPNQIEVIGPPSPAGASEAAKKTTATAPSDPPEGSPAKLKSEIEEDLKLISSYKKQLSDLIKKYEADGKNVVFDGTPEDKKIYKRVSERLDDAERRVRNKKDKIKEAEEKKAATSGSPPKPSDKKVGSVTPKTDKPTDAKETAKEKEPCRGFGTYTYSGVTPEDLNWVRTKDTYGRVHRRPRQGHQYGTLKMERFLMGLNNVPGGEDFGLGYKVPEHLKKGAFVPAFAKPGWVFCDVSIKTGGDTAGHLTHETGIGVDLSFPTIYKDPTSGKVFRGMNFYTYVKPGAKIKKTDRGKFHGNKYGESKKNADLQWDRDIDQFAFMEFLKYAMPQSIVIIMYQGFKKYIEATLHDFAKNSKQGWSVEHPAYKAWKVNGGRCSLSYDSTTHSNHFHLRLLPPGIAPGPHEALYAPAGGPGFDKKGPYGRIDPGNPGFVPWNQSKLGKGTVETYAGGKYKKK